METGCQVRKRRRSSKHAHFDDKTARGERRQDEREDQPATYGARSSHWWTAFKDVPVHGDSLAGKSEGNICL